MLIGQSPTASPGLSVSEAERQIVFSFMFGVKLETLWTVEKISLGKVIKDRFENGLDNCTLGCRTWVLGAQENSCAIGKIAILMTMRSILQRSSAKAVGATILPNSSPELPSALPVLHCKFNLAKIACGLHGYSSFTDLQKAGH